jgi:nitric oxide reductase subunit B
VLQEGLWYARSQEIVQGPVFRTLTSVRSLGGLVFVIGGVLPLIWFVVSRALRIRRNETTESGEWSPRSDGWANTSDPQPGE